VEKQAKQKTEISFCLFGLFVDLEDGGIDLSRNIIIKHLLKYKAPHSASCVI
jgi:hypothetical protein